uniref:Uncharacterized protein n=1 Tax=Arundo donax TaxID=35708 RepID=A0A0A9BNE4_ARUDO
MILAYEFIYIKRLHGYRTSYMQRQEWFWVIGSNSGKLCI